MKKILLSGLLMFISLWSMTQNAGIITGKVIDTDNNPLPFATVHIEGTAIGSITNSEGVYLLKDLKPGTYTLLFRFIGFETTAKENIIVSQGETDTINAVLKMNSKVLKGVTISVRRSRSKEVALLEDQKQAKVMKQSIGAQELSREGVSNVADGVKKIAGISKQKSTGLIVRGLSERYNFLTINGLPIITANPDKKIIPLDNLTTNIVRNIDVFKTFNTGLYGDFAGASINVITKDIPYKSTTKVTFGVGANTQTTFQDFKIDDGNGVAMLGIAGKDIKLPNTYGKDLVKLGYSSTSQESMHLFDNSFNVNNYKAPLSTNFGITHGNRFRLEKGREIGYYVGVNFGNNFHTISNAEIASLNTQGGYNSHYNDVERYSLSTEKSALVSVLYKNRDEFSLKFNNIFLKNTENYTEEQFGYNSEANNEFFSRLSRYRSTIANQTQLLGNWYWSENKKYQIQFGVSYGFGNYKEPDRKILYAEGIGNNSELYNTNGNDPTRFFADLDINNYNGFLKYTIGLGKLSEENEKEYRQYLTVGVDFNSLHYSYFNRVVRLNVNPMHFPSGVNSLNKIPLNTNDPELFIQNGFKQGWLNYKDASDASKFSLIDQNTAATYISYNFSTNQWGFTIGLRGEYFKRSIKYRKPTSGIYSNYLIAENKAPFDLMPAINIKYGLNEYSNLRLATSITSTRPRIREILPIRYLSGPFALVTGNPELHNSTNYNLDLKYELFPKSGGIFSVTAFGKFINNPIETIVTPVAGGSSIGFANTGKAVIYGLELLYQTDFKQLFGIASLRDLRIGINTTLMYSQVTIDKTKENLKFLTNSERALQGASPIIINADLSYKKQFNDNWKSIFTVTYNVFGRRIYSVGGANLGDIYQQSFNQLNFIWGNTFGHFSVNLKVENILNDAFKLEQTPTRVMNSSTGDKGNVSLKKESPIIITGYKRGIDFSVSISYTF